MTQPALSKTLARLREHFDDQLFVRVAFEMKPTSKTLCLAPQIQNILREVSLLESEQLPFTPETSKRDFKFAGPDRSEEHTSELQSLMRISYAVFCLKKKKTEKNSKLNNNPLKNTPKTT